MSDRHFKGVARRTAQAIAGQVRFSKPEQRQQNRVQATDAIPVLVVWKRPSAGWKNEVCLKIKGWNFESSFCRHWRINHNGLSLNSGSVPPKQNTASIVHLPLHVGCEPASDSYPLARQVALLALCLRLICDEQWHRLQALQQQQWKLNSLPVRQAQLALQRPSPLAFIPRRKRSRAWRSVFVLGLTGPQADVQKSIRKYEVDLPCFCTERRSQAKVQVFSATTDHRV